MKNISINGKTFAIILIVVTVVFVFWYYSQAPTARSLRGLGAKKKKPNYQDDEFWTKFALKNIELSKNLNIESLYYFDMDLDEILEVYHSKKTLFSPAEADNEHYLIVIGFSSKNRYIGYFLQYNPINVNLEVIEIFIPDENELEKYYFGQF